MLKKGYDMVGIDDNDTWIPAHEQTPNDAHAATVSGTAVMGQASAAQPSLQPETSGMMATAPALAALFKPHDIEVFEQRLRS